MRSKVLGRPRPERYSGFVHESSRLAWQTLFHIFAVARARRGAQCLPAWGRATSSGWSLKPSGGAISNIYLDIASVPPPTAKARGKTPAVPQPAPEPRPVPIPPPAPSRPQRPPSRERPPQNGAQNGARQVVRPRRRSDGNGAAASDRNALLAVHAVEKTFVGRKVVKGVSLYVRKGEAVGLARSQRRRQNHRVLHDHRTYQG